MSRILDGDKTSDCSTKGEVSSGDPATAVGMRAVKAFPAGMRCILPLLYLDAQLL